MPNKSRKTWLHQHVNDAYVKQAKAGGWRSRAVFKLKQIDEKDHLLAPGMLVVDLGAAPGSWAQYAAQRVSPGGRVMALDVLPMLPLPGVQLIDGDFREDATLARLEQALAGCPVDLVLSDMAPNLSGIAATDQARMAHLVELALDFAHRHLRTGGTMLVKLFQGPDFMALRRRMEQEFAKVAVRKPEASRGRSAESYLLARDKK